jgi:hypothetical protein
MSTKPNQFRSLIAASGQSPVAQTSMQTSIQTAIQASESSNPRRRLGKRTAPDYVQVGVYIPKRLHNEAKVLLIHEGADRDFSQLIGDLLAEYVLGQSAATATNRSIESSLKR